MSVFFACQQISDAIHRKTGAHIYMHTQTLVHAYKHKLRVRLGKEAGRKMVVIIVSSL